MSRSYDSMDPKVMDDDMLKAAVGEQGPQEEAGQLAKQEGILFKDVLSLQLDFQNILRIDNLWQFENLQKLQLNNNIIERIEGLENLVNLIWLDLSFNNIETIEGLDTLVNLEDLSLSNNRISKMDSLDALVKLQVLSLGNNQISNIMNKEMAKLKHQYSIDELKHREALMQARLEDEQARREKLAEHKLAFIDHLDGSFLFDSMYSEDVEGNKLSYLPGVGELLEAYKDKFVIICLNIFEYGLKQQEKRKLELDTFNECVQEAIQENQDQGKLKVAKFEERHLLNLNTIREESDLPTIEKKLLECSDDINELFNMLMTLEMQLVEQLEETINMFERNITDLVGLFIENVQSLMAQCRDLENHHHEKILEIAINTLEKILKGEMDEDLPDDVRALFVDKDTIVNAVGASHDIHLLKIDNREDELVTGINSWCAQLLDKIHKDEIMRNRKRVKEINQYVDHMQSELDNLECGDIID
ncbi:dynein regulatory complex subunit 3 isoform X2 [Peromyscus maniculatus bairdii]|uniref:dynein regulatory complex subunit 3 isoform X2 n=1 Tax=Peromyscus maniculatus bairdii TaxID=230844 RepID=UPI003FD069D1